MVYSARMLARHLKPNTHINMYKYTNNSTTITKNMCSSRHFFKKRRAKLKQRN